MNFQLQFGFSDFGPVEVTDKHAHDVLTGKYGPFPLTALQSRVLGLLLSHQGAKNAIPLRDVVGKLRARYSKNYSERQVKEAVRGLTVDFRVRIAAPRTGKTGYYLVTTSAEARAAARPYIAEGIKLFQRARVLLDQHDVAELDGQIRLLLEGKKEIA
ncbi:MAG TPA: hypothetical protein VFB79_18680 [Candidatus Angelobacter sp.]|nr:hypothetical protein [Candidatus Angelobacter sp.]